MIRDYRDSPNVCSLGILEFEILLAYVGFVISLRNNIWNSSNSSYKISPNSNKRIGSIFIILCIFYIPSQLFFFFFIKNPPSFQNFMYHLHMALPKFSKTLYIFQKLHIYFSNTHPPTKKKKKQNFLGHPYMIPIVPIFDATHFAHGQGTKIN